MKNNIIKIGLFILSALTAIFIELNLNLNIKLIDSFSYDGIKLLFLTILYYIGLNKVLEKKEKRFMIISLIVAIIFSVLEIVGSSICTYQTLEAIIGSKEAIIKSILKLLAYIVSFYIINGFIFTMFFSKIHLKEEQIKNFFTNNKRSLLLCALVIFVAYIPYFLNSYPGIYTVDSIAEMNDAIHNMGNLVNHHSILHISIISICLNIGKMFGEYSIGVAIYSILQMLFTAFTFSYVIKYMAKININRVFRIIALLFFALFPPFASYSITMWKDIPFALSIVLFVIELLEMIYNKQYFKRKRNMIKTVLIAILVILFKNNGVYIVVISMVMMFAFMKLDRKKVGIIILCLLSFYLIFKGPVFKIFNIKNGPVREALSVPLQQIARTVKYKGDKLTDEEKQSIYKFLPVNDIGDRYYPLISDNVKDCFNNEEFKNNKTEFFSIWLRLLVKYPKEYIESFLVGSYGYWYPQECNWIIPDWYTYDNTEMIDYNSINRVDIKSIDIIAKVINKRSVPLVSNLWSIGFIFFVTIMQIAYIVYKKKYKLVLAYVPILVLWLTSVASPVWCEFRYIYGMFTSFPILLIAGISLSNKNEK